MSFCPRVHVHRHDIIHAVLSACHLTCIVSYFLSALGRYSAGFCSYCWEICFK